MGAGQTKKGKPLLVEGRSVPMSWLSRFKSSSLLAAGDRMDRKEEIRGLLPRAVSEAEQEVLG